MSTPDFESLANPGLRGLRAYDPGHDIVVLRRRFAMESLVELGSNENAFGASPAAIEAIGRSLPDIHRYPDPLGADLKSALAQRLGLQPAQVLLGNGSHELLMMLAQAFAGPEAEVLASQFGFAVYAIAAKAAGAPFRQARALDEGAMARGHDLAAIADAITPATRLVYLANPNNPTGTWFSTAALTEFMSTVSNDVLVVVDEAYLEYVTDDALVSAVSLLAHFPNLVVTRTFSKAHGLAGLRVGYACAHPGLLAILERIRESFNVNLPGLAGCLAALDDTAHLATVQALNAAAREWLRRQLAQRGLSVASTQTNFLLLDFGRTAAEIERGLLDRAVVLRPMAGYGLPTCLRLTVGTEQENQRFLAALDEVIA